MSLNDIKSSYFIQILFCHLSEEMKLKIVKYNKNYQNLLNINLINYKIFSGKYIEYESNGKAKEYDSYDDHLIYEGEYLNGKRNGEGKEYDEDGKGKILFEGNYLNGKRNGEGKEYFSNEELKFKGEYLNGKKWNGNGYDIYGHMVYELKNGNGFVKEYDDYDEYDLEFEGEYKNGEKNGKGTSYDGYSKEFDGEYLNGRKWNGKIYDGIDNNDDNIICELKEGKGLMKMFFNRDNILKREGQFLNGELNGKVREFNNKGQLIFEGEYLDGILTGKVKEYYKGEIKFEGEYLYGHKRKGKEYIKGKLEYEGEYLFDRKWNGKGYDKNGNIIYEVINGNGTVKEYKEYDEGDILVFEGEYLNGKRNGKGKEYDYKGRVMFEGEYLNGKRWNGKGLEYNFVTGYHDNIKYLNGKTI